MIVGAGRAGLAAAEELSGRGFTGEVVVLCEETEPPYDRPACSKGLLTGNRRPRDAYLPLPDGPRVNWQLGRRVIRLDPVGRAVITAKGEIHRYDGLVIATGARPVAPAGWPVGAPGLHLLHGLADAWRLRGDLRQAGRVAVIGGGLTGCEVAYAVHKLARDCVLIESQPTLMSRALGAVAARHATEEIASSGVRLRLGHRVAGLRRGRRGWIVTLDDGEELVVDVVVASVGHRPDTGWLAGNASLDISDGVLCDDSLRVVGAADVVAAGEVARWQDPNHPGEPRRIGQWITALEQGRAAVRTLLAGSHGAPAVSLVPRFWSEQFGMRIQVCGDLPAAADIAVHELRPGRRDPVRGGMVVTYSRGDRPVGLVGINASHVFTSMAQSLMAHPLMSGAGVGSGWSGRSGPVGVR